MITSLLCILLCLCLIQCKDDNKQNRWAETTELLPEPDLLKKENENLLKANALELQSEWDCDFAKNYGGCWFDEEKNLNVVIVSLDLDTISFISNIIDCNNVRFVEGMYSQEELKSAYDKIIERHKALTADEAYNLENPGALCSRIDSIALNIKENCISVQIVGLTEQDEKEFLETYYDFEMIKFCDTRSHQLLTTVGVARRVVIIISGLPYSYSVGYRAYRVTSAGNYYGFVTAGHGGFL